MEALAGESFHMKMYSPARASTSCSIQFNTENTNMAYYSALCLLSSVVMNSFRYLTDDCTDLCLHGGRCVLGQCVCPLNYEGEHCEKGNV